MDLQIRQQRLNQANMALAIIAKYGRKFFSYKDFISAFLLENGRIWFVDAYSQKKIWVCRKGEWRGFSEGGTLKSLVEALYKYISKGVLVPKGHFGPWPDYICGGDLWGYGADMEKVRKEIKDLNILTD